MTESTPDPIIEQPIIEPEPDGFGDPVRPKPIIDFGDFIYNEHRIALLKRWGDLQRSHMSFGCPLTIDDPNAAAVCVIHGTPVDTRELTQEDFLGSFASEIPPSKR